VANNQIAAQVPLAQPANQISIGATIISEVFAHFFVVGQGGAVPAAISCASGLYVQQYDRVNAVFSSQSPILEAEQSRDNWLALRVWSGTMPNPAAITQIISNGSLTFEWRGAVRLDQGQALSVVLANSAASTQNVVIQGFIKYKGRIVF
jgi:hypothetical protein